MQDASDSSTRNSIRHTIAFALIVAVFFGVLVSAVSVLLEPAQTKNRQREQQQLLDELMRSQPGFENIADQDAQFKMLHRVVEMVSGCYVDAFDSSQYVTVTDPDHPHNQLPLSKAEDIAGIGVRPRYALVHVLLDGDQLAGVVLPVYGSGYQSRLRAYLTLAADVNAVRSLVFYDHKETPGMGGRISDAGWQSRWQHKKLRDADGVVRIGVADTALGSASDHPYLIDAMTGASITGRGVTNLLRFWAGPLGFGPYLANLQSGAPCTEH